MGLGVAILVNGTSDPGLAGAQEVEIHERVGEPTTYRLRYPLVVRDGDVPLLRDARFDPGSQLAVVIPVANANVYLVKGPVTAHRSHIEHGMVDAWLDVHGTDASIEMEREIKTKVWSDGTAADAVRTIIGDHKMTPDVSDTPSRSVEKKHSLVQRDTDLRFARRLARRYGFYFWCTADSSGNLIGHFKRPTLTGTAPRIQINLDASNIAAVDLYADFERPTSAVAGQLDLANKKAIDGAVPKAPLTLLGERGLADITRDPRTVQVVAPVDDADDLKGRGEGALIEAGWFIRATCQTSFRALGTVLRPDSIVDLQGLGKRHSGTYWLYGVRHQIDASAHVMELELYRNAWGS
jgi:phage protein D